MKVQPTVIYEDNHLLVVNKPAGMLSQGDKTGDNTIIDWGKQYLKEKYNKPGNVYLGLVHRIDRPTSGVLVLAKTSKALPRLNKAFANRAVQKTYWAITENRLPKPSDTLVQYLIKNQKTNKSTAYPTEKTNTSKAELRYEHLVSGDRYHLYEITPKTGRHHQIRVQLSNNGAVIKGDLKYGAKRSNKDASICLHARSLRLTHPVTKEEMVFTAPVPVLQPWMALEEMI